MILGVFFFINFILMSLKQIEFIKVNSNFSINSGAHW